MLQLRNDTPLAGTVMLLPDAEGIDTLFAVVKGTFGIAPSPAIAEEQVPVTVAPVFRGDPASSSLALASDLSLPKPTTDVLLLGHACAPGGRAVTAMHVAVRVGPVQQRARVVGDRVWMSDGMTYGATPPAPFERMPLVWERAFGGRDVSPAGPREESRNPVGSGYRAGDGTLAVEGLALPNIEDPDHPVTSWKQTPRPVGFGPTLGHWLPRRRWAGTYDERWQKERSPYLPTDFDPRFLQVAPPELITPGPLVGGEPVELSGVHPAGTLRFPLPAVRPRVVFDVAGRHEERPVALDTVLLEPDAMRVILVWRAALRCDKQALRVRAVAVTLPTAA